MYLWLWLLAKYNFKGICEFKKCDIVTPMITNWSVWKIILFNCFCPIPYTVLLYSAMQLTIATSERFLISLTTFQQLLTFNGFHLKWLIKLWRLATDSIVHSLRLLKFPHEWMVNLTVYYLISPLCTVPTIW